MDEFYAGTVLTVVYIRTIRQDKVLGFNNQWHNFNVFIICGHLKPQNSMIALSLTTRGHMKFKLCSRNVFTEMKSFLKPFYYTVLVLMMCRVIWSKYKAIHLVTLSLYFLVENMEPGHLDFVWLIINTKAEHFQETILTRIISGKFHLFKDGFKK